MPSCTRPCETVPLHTCPPGKSQMAVASAWGLGFGTASPVKGSAVPGKDYEPLSGMLVFAHGETEHEIEVPVMDDNEYEKEP